MKGVKAKNLTRVNKTCHLYKNTHPLFPQPRPASQTNNSSFNNNQSKTCLLSRGSLFLRTHIFIRNTILFEKVSSREINLFLCLFKNQNPREASSRSRIFLISLVYVFFQNQREASSRSKMFLNSLEYVCIFVCLFVLRLLAKRKTIQS